MKTKCLSVTDIPAQAERAEVVSVVQISQSYASELGGPAEIRLWPAAHRVPVMRKM